MVHKRAILLGMLTAFVLPLIASNKTPANNEIKGGAVIDSGTFGIFQRGQRVATETFQVKQSEAGSVTTSEINTTGDVAIQSSELQLTVTGDLVKYLWKETKPDKSESDLTPGDQVIVQHIDSGSKEKPQEIPYVLPTSTFVLDDYFFVQREVLAWKYMASECGSALQNCQMRPASFGVIIPRQHTSGSLTIEFKGLEKTDYHGSQQQLYHFIMHVDEVDWSLYLDDHNRLVKVDIPTEETTALRD